MFERFLDAQEDIYETVTRELRAGAKRSHWMWFIFPQLAALGRSDTAKLYGLADTAEAAAYAAHPVLGARLRECVGILNGVEGRSAEQILGFPDVLKYRSCLTLFWRATESEIFHAGLARYYDGVEDELTLRELDA